MSMDCYIHISLRPHSSHLSLSFLRSALVVTPLTAMVSVQHGEKRERGYTPIIYYNNVRGERQWIRVTSWLCPQHQLDQRAPQLSVEISLTPHRSRSARRTARSACLLASSCFLHASRSLISPDHYASPAVSLASAFLSPSPFEWRAIELL